MAPSATYSDAGAVLDTLATAIVVADQSLQLRYMNPSAEALFGVSLQRSIGASIRELLHPGSAAIVDSLTGAFDTDQSITQRAIELTVRSGEAVIVDLTITLDRRLDHRQDRLPDRHLDQLIFELQPINRLIRINREDHTMASHETTRQLVRGLAHEVKNPLGGLRGAAQLLERELTNPDHTEYTRIIIEEADRLTDLVDRMLGPNREPQLKHFNIHEVLERVFRLVDAELVGKIQFERDYDPSLPEVYGDELQIIQALLNIVRNAAQILEEHAIRGPTITLRTRVVRTFTIGTVMHRIAAQIDIIDNGPGIKDEMVERIFYPMISDRPTGTGLGLAITQTIIGQHRGMIECDTKPGRTCFSVFLPLDNHNGENHEQ